MGSERTISESAVRKATGRGWGPWLRILDAFGGRERSHRDMARYLREQRGVSAWWAQAITVRYELERGLREEGQRGRTFEVSVTRTVQVPAGQAFEALTRARHWNRWFTSNARVNAKPGGRYANGDGDRGEFRRVEPGLISFTWENERHCPDTLVEITLVPQGPDRVQIRLTHRKLASAADRDEMRGGSSWALDSLRSYLETGKGIPSEAWEPR